MSLSPPKHDGLRRLNFGSIATGILEHPRGDFDLLETYEGLCALWVKVADMDLVEEPQFRLAVLDAAKCLVGGGTLTSIDRQAKDVVEEFVGSSEIPKIPAGIAVQGLEWTDGKRLADAWFPPRENDGVVVVAVRSGGCYLAPIVAAQLIANGTRADLASVRPGRQMDEALSLPRHQAIIVDDPPLSGRAISVVAEHLISHGFKVDLLLPCFHETVCQEALGGIGASLTTLPRTLWASSQRMEADSIRNYLRHPWLLDDNDICEFDGFVEGFHNSAIARWPNLRDRSAVKSSFWVNDGTHSDPRRLVAQWISPGIFGHAARRTARSLNGDPVLPRVVAIGRELVISEWLSGSKVSASTSSEGAFEYVARRSRLLPVDGSSLQVPDHRVSEMAKSFAILGEHLEIERWMVEKLNLLPASLPDNRCETEKWIVAGGQIVKTGYLSHTYRRENWTLSPLLDIVSVECALKVSEGATIEFCEREWGADRETMRSALAVATLYYGMARGEQLKRMYTEESRISLCIEAIRLFHMVYRASKFIQSALLRDLGYLNIDVEVVRIMRSGVDSMVGVTIPVEREPPLTWRQSFPPSEKALSALSPHFDLEWLQAISAYALFPRGAPSQWSQARIALEDMAVTESDSYLIGWAGVPCVSFMVNSGFMKMPNFGVVDR